MKIRITLVIALLVALGPFMSISIRSRHKAPTIKMRLPRTFPLGEGTLYVVTFEMVPSSP